MQLHGRTQRQQRLRLDGISTVWTVAREQRCVGAVVKVPGACIFHMLLLHKNNSFRERIAPFAGSCTLLVRAYSSLERPLFGPLRLFEPRWPEACRAAGEAHRPHRLQDSTKARVTISVSRCLSMLSRECRIDGLSALCSSACRLSMKVQTVLCTDETAKPPAVLQGGS